jgi:hypothetical protein
MSRCEVLVVEFPAPESRFEGHLLGALERAESGGALRVREALVVGREPGSGELFMLRRTGGAAGLVGATTDFRLDDRRRRAATSKCLAGPEAASLEALGATLAPGAAVVAVVVEHAWAAVLEDAVGRAGASVITDDTVPEVPDLAARALAAVAGTHAAS